MDEESRVLRIPVIMAHHDDVSMAPRAEDQYDTTIEADALSTSSDKILRELCSSEENQILDCPLQPRLRMPTILQFRRESQDQVMEAQKVPHQRGDAPAPCEFCGQPASPFPDLTDLSNSAEPERFCCIEALNLVEALSREWSLLLQTQDQGYEAAPIPSDTLTKEQELSFTAWEDEERRQQEGDLEQYFQATHPVIVPADYSTRTISFQLSSCVSKVSEKPSAPQDSGKEEEVVLDHREEEFQTGPGVFGFSIVHQKTNIGLKEKCYTNGNKFLTVFPDGSAQVFYPSGRLAILITAGNSKAEMVCIVQEDHTPNPTMRALFQSTGRATCYHSNGNVWVSTDVFGGQCSDETGARVRRWRWSGHGDTPTPLRPLFLSLNRSVGVRILGQDRMFVTFLAEGCQARFSVGTCVQIKDASTTIPFTGHSISREELFLLAGRIRLHRTLGRLHHCLRLPSNPRPPPARPLPSLVSLARALQELCGSMKMEERDHDFIQACLQECV